MPNSLKCRLKKLAYQGLLSKKDLSRIYTDNDVIAEFEKIKTEIYRHHNITCNLKCANCFLEYNCELRRVDLLEDLAIIDNHISELKGE